MLGKSHLSRQALAGGVISQRFEMKYILTAYQAEVIRQYISPFVEPDRKAKFGHRYELSSVYLDDPKLSLYWASNLGENKRFKLRIRTYSEDTSEPNFFEIKSRLNGIVMKKRAMVRKEGLALFLQGQPIPRDFFVVDDPSQLENMELFREYAARLNATPRVHVRYTREAYNSRFGDPVRITFDSDIACLPTVGSIGEVRLNGRGWRRLMEPAVILEVKFTDTYPAWVQDLIYRFDLLRDSFAKYVYSVRLLKDEGFDIKHPPAAMTHPALQEGNGNGRHR